MAKKDRLKEIEIERGEKLTSLIPRLLNKYSKDERGAREATADDLGVHVNTVHRWCRQFHVERLEHVEYVLAGEPDVAV